MLQWRKSQVKLSVVNFFGEDQHFSADSCKKKCLVNNCRQICGLSSQCCGLPLATAPFFLIDNVKKGTLRRKKGLQLPFSPS